MCTMKRIEKKKTEEEETNSGRMLRERTPSLGLNPTSCDFVVTSPYCNPFFLLSFRDQLAAQASTSCTKQSKKAEAKWRENFAHSIYIASLRLLPVPV